MLRKQPAFQDLCFLAFMGFMTTLFIMGTSHVFGCVIIIPRTWDCAFLLYNGNTSRGTLCLALSISPIFRPRKLLIIFFFTPGSYKTPGISSDIH